MANEPEREKPVPCGPEALARPDRSGGADPVVRVVRAVSAVEATSAPRAPGRNRPVSTTGWIERRRTCWAYSPGGHYTELVRATAGIRFADCYHVTFRSGRPLAATGKRVYQLCHPRRSPLRTLVNALQALWVLWRERPELVVSTGADVAVPTLVLAKLFGAKVVFVETGGTIAPSLAGRLVYPFCDLFVVQWPEKLAHFPKAVLSRGLLL